MTGIFQVFFFNKFANISTFQFFSVKMDDFILIYTAPIGAVYIKIKSFFISPTVGKFTGFTPAYIYIYIYIYIYMTVSEN